VLDGVDDYVETSFDATSYFPLTVCFWVKSDNNSSRQILVDQSTGATGFGIRIYAGSIEAFYYQGGTTNLNSVISSFPSSTWSYVSVVYDTNIQKGYLNGSLSVSNTISLTESGRTPDTLDEMRIGVQNDGASYGGQALYMDGQFAQVKVYNKALTANEIAQNYNALKNRFV
jgi:hypothetical protein